MIAMFKLTAVPQSVTGYLSRYLMELESGLYVGTTTRALAEHLWDQVVAYSGDGYAVAMFSGGSELGMTLRTHNHPTLTILDNFGAPLAAISHGS
jgi:CRISPR-associated protein Cas2